MRYTEGKQSSRNEQTRSDLQSTVERDVTNVIRDPKGQETGQKFFFKEIMT